MATAWLIQPGPLNVETHHGAKALRRDVLGQRHVLPAGVVHEQVDAAVPIEHPVDQSLHVLLLADVALGGLTASAVRSRRGLLERLEPASTHHHGRAARRQLQGAGAAEPAAAAAHDRDLTLKQARREDLRGHRLGRLTAGRDPENWPWKPEPDPLRRLGARQLLERVRVHHEQERPTGCGKIFVARLPGPPWRREL